MKAKTLTTIIAITGATFLEQTSPLYINLEEQHYVIEKSQEEGERDLRHLARTTKFEESWIYIETPTTQTWYESGSSQSRISTNTSIEVREKALETQDITKYVHYHIHPEQKRRKDRWLVNSASAGDLWFYAFVEWKITHDSLGEQTTRQAKIITPYLTYTFEMNNIDPFYTKNKSLNITDEFREEKKLGRHFSLEPEDLYIESQDLVQRINEHNDWIHASVELTTH
jgi:hypothetical protein